MRDAGNARCRVRTSDILLSPRPRPHMTAKPTWDLLLRGQIKLDLPGRVGLGAQLAAQWASGLVKFPPQIESAIASSDLKLVGDAFIPPIPEPFSALASAR